VGVSSINFFFPLGYINELIFSIKESSSAYKTFEQEEKSFGGELYSKMNPVF
jgi:hypothetical protein